MPQHTTRRSHGRGLLLALGLSTSRVVAQTTSAFTDQATGIQFQRFFGAKTDFGFGIALPTNPSNSFIGQLSFPLANGAGWGGFSLTGDMEGPLMMVCWPNNGAVVASFRQAFNEDDSPPEVTGAFSVKPIAQATSVNNTFMTFTFLCEGCLDDSLGLGPAQTAGTAEMGWALASRAVRNPASSAGVLGFHNSGFGDFKANLAAARSAEFDTWAALAGAALPPAAGAQAFDQSAAFGSGDDDSGNDSDDSSRGGGQAGGGGATIGGGLTGGGGGQTGGGQAGGRGGFNSDSDGSDSDNGRRRRRSLSLKARQTGGRSGGVQTGGPGTDTDGFNSATDGFVSATDGLDSGSDIVRGGALRSTTGRVPRSRRAAVVTSGLKARQTGGRAGGQSQGGFGTDTDGVNSGTDGFDSDSDIGRRSVTPVRHVAASRPVGGGAAISGLVKRQTRGRTGGRVTGGRARGGFSTDSGNDNGFNSPDGGFSD